MTNRRKRAVARAAKAGVSGISHALLFILKIIGVVLLIGITTGVIFACIFVIHIKTNLVTTDLNVDMEEFTLNQTSFIYYQDPDTGKYNELVALQGTEDRIWVDYEDMPQYFEQAVVSIEDQRFYTHSGVDWYRTAGAFVNMFLGMKNTFGGSTITQQLIKNITGENEATVQRKLAEIFRALEFEKKYDKWEIVEGYLNFVYFGHGQSGIGAAARYYYNKEVSELSLAEICSIVGITNNPSIYSPRVSPEKNKERQETILYKMFEQGYINKQEYDSAVAEKLKFSINLGNNQDTEIYTWFEEAVIDDVVTYLAESRGVSRKVANQLLLSGGYKIYSTIDIDIQEKVDTIYQDLEQIPQVSGSSQKFRSAIVITDPYTGNIVALAGDTGEKKANLIQSYATDTKRPPGSSFKPLAVYSQGLDLGIITPETNYEDENDIVLTGKPGWLPYNDNRKNRGIVTIRQAVVSSLNTISAQVLDKVTPAVSYSFLTQALNLELDPADEDYAPLALGQLTWGVTVREMATAYSILPTNGVFTESRTFTHIYDSEDKLIYENVPEANAVISEAAAYWMTDILNDAVNYGTGYEAKLSNMPVAGKTGTTSSKCDRWFVGYTPYYVAAVWTGYEIPVAISSKGNPAAQLWKKVMTLVHEDLEYKNFTKPSNTYLTPVAGVEPVTYYIRGITTDELGNMTILYEEEAGKRGIGREVTVAAKEIDGYTLVGSSEVKFNVSDIPELNIIEFEYVSNTPVIPDPPVDPDDPVDPNAPVDPNDPNQPADPNDPNAPVDPSEPTTPTDPDIPDTPDNPPDPSTPTDPSTPSDPVTPDTPDTPPATPENPEDTAGGTVTE